MVDVVALCQELVRIPSIGAVHRETAVVAHLRELLAGAVPAARLEVVEGKPGRPNLLCTIDSGRPGPALILNGHTDTVGVEEDSWTHGGPYSGVLADGQVWGRGSMDMKGGIAALVAATIAHVEAGGPAAGRILLTATADEDTEGLWGLPWLAEQGLLDGDAALVAEAAGVEADFDRLYVANRGHGFATVEVETARSRHSSLYTLDRPHAVAVAARLVTELEQRFRPGPASHPLFPGGPTVVAGSTFEVPDEHADLPERVAFQVEGRMLPGAEPGCFMRELEAFLRAIEVPNATVTIREHPLFPPWLPAGELAVDHPLATAALAAVRRAGYPDADFAGWPAFSEASLLAARGIPTLPGIGPGRLSLAHQPDEHVSVRSLRASVAIYLELFGQILREDSIMPPRAGGCGVR